MKYTLLGDEKSIVYVNSDDLILLDVQSALDLIANIGYDTNCTKIIIDKKCICEDFFKLSTCIAGEILQKFINYHAKLAIVGDYSHYTSKPLRDFIYESNQGNHFYFVSSIEEAIVKLS